MTDVTITRDIDVSAGKVWNVLSDFEHAPIPSFSVTVEKKGDSDAGGIGTVRMITVGKRQIREKLESIKHPSLFTHRVISGVPVKDYVGSVGINPLKSKTRISWKVQFIPNVIGTGWILKQIIKKTINRIINEIEIEYRD